MKMKLVLLLMIVISFTGCKVLVSPSSHKKASKLIENFNRQRKFDSKWEDDSRSSPSSYHLRDGMLKITTRPQFADRVKVKSRRNDFGVGTYQWRIYVPQFDLYDQCNIGAFLYHSGEFNYEIDFEIGSGTKKHRDQLKAKPMEVLVHCTSQMGPFDTEIFKIESKNWYDFKIELGIGTNNQYLVLWYIDNELVKTLQTNISSEITFSVHHSLENLEFIGDQLPVKQNYVLFDRFVFRN